MEIGRLFLAVSALTVLTLVPCSAPAEEFPESMLGLIKPNSRLLLYKPLERDYYEITLVAEEQLPMEADSRELDARAMAEKYPQLASRYEQALEQAERRIQERREL